MSGCKACGMDVEPIEGRCPECGTSLVEGTQSFEAVGTDPPDAESRPAPSQQPVLVVQKGPEVGERFELDAPSFIVGRDPACDIFLNDVTVSRHHAELTVDGDTVSLRDAGSLNGTYINATRVDQATLAHGDVVQVGRFEMIFMAGGAG